MPIRGARTLGDIEGEGVERLTIGCEKCDRVGSYALARLIVDHGPEQGLPDLLAYLSRNCPKRANLSLDRCGAVYDFAAE